MTHLVARLILSMLALPATGALVLLLLGALLASAGPGGPPPPEFAVAMWAVVYLFIGLYWVFLWRPMVRWTPSRLRWTIATAPVAIAIGAFCGALFHALTAGAPAFIAILFGGGVPPIVWVLATVFIWRETAEERIARLTLAGAEAVPCPLCGYDMRGLTSANCPECGGRFTLEQIMKARAKAESLEHSA